MIGHMLDTRKTKAFNLSETVAAAGSLPSRLGAISAKWFSLHWLHDVSASKPKQLCSVITFNISNRSSLQSKEK